MRGVSHMMCKYVKCTDKRCVVSVIIEVGIKTLTMPTFPILSRNFFNTSSVREAVYINVHTPTGSCPTLYVHIRLTQPVFGSLGVHLAEH